MSLHLLPKISSSCLSPHFTTTHTSQLFPVKSLSLFKKENNKNLTLLSVRRKRRNPIQHRSAPVVVAAQSNNVFFKVLQTAWRVGKDGIETGTNLVPESIPRPIAKISVVGVGSVVLLFILKSFISTVFFVLGVMGLIYFVFIALNKDEGPKGTKDIPTEEDSLEEARRIMEKYK